MSQRIQRIVPSNLRSNHGISKISLSGDEVLEGMRKRLTLIARERDKEIQIDREREREKSSNGVETLSNPEIAHPLVCGQPRGWFQERESEGWWLRQRHQELESVRMWTIPILLQGGSIHVRVGGHCLRAVSKLHAKPTNHPSSSFTTIGKLSSVGMNVSRPDGSTTDRDSLLERFEIESRNLGDIRFVRCYSQIFVCYIFSLLSWILKTNFICEIRNIKLQGDFLIQEHFDILKTVRIGYVKFCHTPAISHVCNNLRSLWYSPPFRINLSMPQDSPPLTDQFDMIWGWREVFTRASLAATLFLSD